MDIKNIDRLDFGSLTTEEAGELGLNAVFLEEDGTYDWIYCLKMFQNRSLLKFVMKTIAVIYALIVITLLVLTKGGKDILLAVGVLCIVFVAVLGIILFSFWLVDKLYDGSYLLIYQMNDAGITFSQTTDQAQITRTIASASAAVNAAGGNIGGVIAGSGLAMSPNSWHADFSKVRSVRGRRSENLIWVNSFLQYLMVYVPDEAYDFVWDYITRRCVNARITSR